MVWERESPLLYGLVLPQGPGLKLANFGVVVLLHYYHVFNQDLFYHRSVFHQALPNSFGPFHALSVQKRWTFFGPYNQY